MRDEVRQALLLGPHATMEERTIDITTTGRRSGQPRRIEIVFYQFENSTYLSGIPAPRPRAWLLNLEAEPHFVFHLKHGVVADLPATATVITDPAEIDDDVVAMYQRDTGLVDIRRANAAHLARARQMGVTVKPHTRVTDVRSSDTEVTIVAGDEIYTAESAVLCVASWLPRLAGALGLAWPMTLSEEQVTYFATPHLRQFAPDRFPVFIWHGDDLFYGFPVYGEAAVKLSRDMRGVWTTLEERSYEIDHDEELYIQRFAEQYLPQAVGPILYSKSCVMTCRPTATSSSMWSPAIPA